MNAKSRFYLTDNFVLIGIVLAALYWASEAERSVFISCSGKGLLPEAVPVFRVENLEYDSPFIAGAIDSKAPCLYRPAGTTDPVDGEGKAGSLGYHPVWAQGAGPFVIMPLFGKTGVLGVLICVYKDGSSV